MKAFILNASPRTQGTVSTILTSITDALVLSGYEVCSLSVRQLHIAPCNGCMSCRTSGTCALPPDDSLRVLHAIQEADLLIIGSPSYWGNMPGTLKILFDRLVYGFIETPAAPCSFPRPRFHGKRALLFISSTAPSPFHLLPNQARGTAKSIRHILKASGIHTIRTLYRPGTSQSALSPKEIGQYTRRAVRFLAPSRPKASIGLTP